MTPWLITAAVLIGLAILPLGVSAKYDENGVLVRVIAGPIRITLYPRKKKEKKTKPKEKPKKKATKPAIDKKKTEQPSSKGGKLENLRPFIQLGLDFLNDFRGKLRVDILEAKLILAGGDPCDLAVNYGRTWSAVGALFPQLERVLVIKKRDIQVECDFTADATTVLARLDMTITLGRLLRLTVHYGIRALKEYFKLKNQQKGGAEHESKSSEYVGEHHHKNP